LDVFLTILIYREYREKELKCKEERGGALVIIMKNNAFYIMKDKNIVI
jgi:hypothetical protein